MQFKFEQRDLIASIATRLANKPVEVKFSESSDSCFTDGKSINIGTLKVEDPFTAMSLAAHEGSHIRFGSKSTEKILNYICGDYPEIAKFVLNVYEDYRCNTLNERVYRGFVKELRRFNVSSVTDMELDNKLVNTLFQLHNRLEYKDMFDDTDTYDIWEQVDKTVTLVNKYLSFESSVIVSKVIVDTILDHHKADPEAEKPTHEEISSITRTGGGTIGSTHIPLPMLGTSATEKKSLEIVKDYEAGVKGDYKRLDKATKRLLKSRKKILEELKKLKIVPKPKDPTYVRSGVRRKDLPLPTHGSGDAYETVRTRHISTIKQLRTEFKRIMRSTNAGRGGRRGRVSVRDLPRFVASNGRFDRVFKIDREDFGANLMIVIDESGSTRGYKIRTEREAVIVLMEALEGTAINTCVIGFSAQNGAKVVGERVYKRFNESLDRDKLDKINMDPSGTGFYENRDGDSFEISARHFSVTNHKNPIIIVLSDGLPSHGGTGYQGEKMTNRSIRELRANGIKLHGIGIGIFAKDTYGEIYDNKDYTLLEIDDLKEKLITMVRKIADNIEVPD